MACDEINPANDHVRELGKGPTPLSCPEMSVALVNTLLADREKP